MCDKLISFIRRKIFRINKYRWNYQYSIRKWDWIKTPEMQRFNAAKDLLNKYLSGGRILDVGCGEGIFFQNIADLDYLFYEGIDISEVAISRIKPTEKSVIVVADMEKYVPVKKPFSVIVINEVLNYSKNPLDLLKRYNQFLREGGVFLIGMFDTKKSEAIWKQLIDDFDEAETIRLKQDAKTWTYKILKSSH